MKYTGPLDPTTMNKDQKQGYVSWANQCSKCNNKKNPDYKYYGGKGIKTLYSSRDFVGWWLTNLKKKKWDQPTVGRIDHDNDYCFENIEMQERIKNSSERCIRLGRPKTEKTAPKKIIVFSSHLSKKIDEFDSITLTAKAYKLNVSTIVRHCQKKFDGSKCGYTFRYAKDIK